jgi:predicted ribosome quality control (RQC) complex YloA/Tae2 family protein
VLDSLTIAALTDELEHKLTGGRVQKIVQIDDASIGLEIYAEHQRHFLVASADSRHPRLYLASTRISADPDRVSPLLLLLRKYARGGQVVAVQQPPLERIVRLSIAKRFWPDKHDHEPDDEAEIVYVDLIVELMGRRSNIILTGDEERILDAVKRVWRDRVTTILPRQGQYAHDTKVLSALPPADLTIERIGDLIDCDAPRLLAGARSPIPA